LLEYAKKAGSIIDTGDPKKRGSFPARGSTEIKAWRTPRLKPFYKYSIVGLSPGHLEEGGGRKSKEKKTVY